MIRKISQWLANALTAVNCVLLLCSVLCVFLAVLDRYILKVSIFWTEEAARFFFTWLAMLTPAIMIFRRGHFDMTFFVDRLLPKVPRHILAMVLRVICLAAVTILMIYGWELAFKMHRQLMPTLPFSITYWYLSIPVGMALMVVAFVLILVEDVRALVRNELK